MGPFHVHAVHHPYKARICPFCPVPSSQHTLVLWGQWGTGTGEMFYLTSTAPKALQRFTQTPSYCLWNAESPGGSRLA